MEELKPGDIVRCDDHKGIWKIVKISKGKNFKDSLYANLVKVLDDNYDKIDKEDTLLCNVTMCHKINRKSLIKTLFTFQDKINNLIKIIG